MNEGAKDLEQKRLKKKVAKETPKKEDTAKVPAKVDVTEQGTKKRKGGHIKMLARKRKRHYPDVDSDDELIMCLRLLHFEANGNFRAFNYLLEVLHIFDRQDLFHLYDLVMNQYSEVTMEGIELILWGDLKIMMESSKEENDQKRYPVSKDLMQRMLDLGLEVERESTVALDLIRFIKQHGSQLTLLHGEELASPGSNSSCIELTIPEQMATGKGISNPFMAGSLPKTTKPT
ncbi:hypothetical protein Tco_0320459 [Tanacetum coccineum]